MISGILWGGIVALLLLRPAKRLVKNLQRWRRYQRIVQIRRHRRSRAFAQRLEDLQVAKNSAIMRQQSFEGRLIYMDDIKNILHVRGNSSTMLQSYRTDDTGFR